MQLSINIPDRIIKKCKKIIPDNKNIESFIIDVISDYIKKRDDRKNDPFFSFITKESGLSNKENLSDISVNHDRHLY